jgi:hypothetical protein
MWLEYLSHGNSHRGAKDLISVFKFWFIKIDMHCIVALEDGILTGCWMQKQVIIYNM